MVSVNIGEQRFDAFREQNAFYIDKTDFIREWWTDGSTVTLITRPRRFGKTFNMSMVECFFSNRYEGRSDLFEGLSIWEECQYRQLQGTFPVIFLSFANIKAAEYEKMHAVMLGDDTDTTACVTGGLAGIVFGFDNIPPRWYEALRGKAEVFFLERHLKGEPFIQ